MGCAYFLADDFQGKKSIPFRKHCYKIVYTTLNEMLPLLLICISCSFSLTFPGASVDSAKLAIFL